MRLSADTPGKAAENMDHLGGARPSALTIARSTRVFFMWLRNYCAPGPIAVRQSSTNEERSHDLSSTTRFRADA